MPDLVRSDLVFMTKEGLQQYEEVLLSRQMNLYRNKKVPRTFALPSEKYLGTFTTPNTNPIYNGIIKKTLAQSSSLKNKELELFTPAIKKMAEDLVRQDLKQVAGAQQ